MYIQSSLLYTVYIHVFHSLDGKPIQLIYRHCKVFTASVIPSAINPHSQSNCLCSQIKVFYSTVLSPYFLISTETSEQLPGEVCSVWYESLRVNSSSIQIMIMHSKCENNVHCFDKVLIALIRLFSLLPQMKQLGYTSSLHLIISGNQNIYQEIIPLHSETSYGFKYHCYSPLYV